MFTLGVPAAQTPTPAGGVTGGLVGLDVVGADGAGGGVGGFRGRRRRLFNSPAVVWRRMERVADVRESFMAV